jgi:hypothetical protein
VKPLEELRDEEEDVQEKDDDNMIKENEEGEGAAAGADKTQKIADASNSASNVPEGSSAGRLVNKRHSAVKSAHWDFLVASSNGNSTANEQLYDFLRGNLATNFLPNFVDFGSDSGIFSSALQKAMDYLEGPLGVEQLANFRTGKSYSSKELAELLGVTGVSTKKGEDVRSLRLCELFNGVSRAIIGSSYENLYHWVGDNRACQSDSDDFNENGNDKPDIIVLKVGRRSVFGPKDNRAHYHNHEVANIGEGKVNSSSDMNFETSILQMMKYAVSSGWHISVRSI